LEASRVYVPPGTFDRVYCPLWLVTAEKLAPTVLTVTPESGLLAESLTVPVMLPEPVENVKFTVVVWLETTWTLDCVTEP
jgi:hypothetical protein